MTLHGQEKMQTQKRSNLESDFQSFYNIRFECPVCKKIYKAYKEIGKYSNSKGEKINKLFLKNTP